MNRLTQRHGEGLIALGHLIIGDRDGEEHRCRAALDRHRVADCPVVARLGGAAVARLNSNIDAYGLLKIGNLLCGSMAIAGNSLHLIWPCPP